MDALGLSMVTIGARGFSQTHDCFLMGGEYPVLLLDWLSVEISGKRLASSTTHHAPGVGIAAKTHAPYSRFVPQKYRGSAIHLATRLSESGGPAKPLPAAPEKTGAALTKRSLAGAVTLDLAIVVHHPAPNPSWYKTHFFCSFLHHYQKS